MCGIVGVAGDLTTRDERVFDLMLKFDEVRGKDITGVASIFPPLSQKDNSILKEAVPSHEFLKRKDYDRHRSQLATCWIGHNRAATAGLVNEDNAHPFQHDHIIGVHNGTLDSWFLDCLEGGEEFGTDSEAIFYNIAKHGVDETIARLHGAYALVWYDESDHTLNFIRNNERPFFYGFSDDGKSFFFGSDPAIYHLAVQYTRHNKPKLRHDKDLAWIPPVNQLHKLQLPKFIGDKWKKDQDFLEIRTIMGEQVYNRHPNNPPKPVRQRSSVAGYNYWPDDVDTERGTWRLVNGEWVDIDEEEKKEEEKVVNLEEEKKKREPSEREVKVGTEWNRYLESSRKRLENDEYLQHVFRTCPTSDGEVLKIEKRIKEKSEQVENADYSCYEDNLALAKRVIGWSQEVDYWTDLIKAYEGTIQIPARTEEEKKTSSLASGNQSPISRNSASLDSPSGFADLSDYEWRQHIRHKACSGCNYSDVNWPGDECQLLDDRSLSYLCPECKDLEYYQQFTIGTQNA